MQEAIYTSSFLLLLVRHLLLEAMHLLLLAYCFYMQEAPHQVYWAKILGQRLVRGTEAVRGDVGWSGGGEALHSICTCYLFR